MPDITNRLTDKEAPVSAGDHDGDLESADEVKVYEDEGEDEKRLSENLSEDKLGLVKENEELNNVDNDVTASSFSPDDNAVLRQKKTVSKQPEYTLSGYPVIPLYLQYPNGSPFGSVSSVFPSHPSLGMYMHSGDSIGLPPPAHMGFSRHPIYGLHPSLFPPDFSHLQYMSASRTCFQVSAYSPSPVSLFGSQRGFAANLDISHPAVLSPGPLQDWSPRSNTVIGYRGSPYSSTPPPADCVNPFYYNQNTPSTSTPKRNIVKKPLNAFMMYMRDMRQTVIDECSLKESAAINQILGVRWGALDQAEQKKYYDRAHKEKELHKKLYPTWSAHENYRTNPKKKKPLKGEYFGEHRPDSGGKVDGSLSAKQYCQRSMNEQDDQDVSNLSRSDNGRGDS